MTQYTTEQVYLLETLVYRDDYSLNDFYEQYSGTDPDLTVGEYIAHIKSTAGPDFENACRAIENDPALMNTRILAVHSEDLYNSGDGCRSIVYGNPSTGEAVVAFRGTAANEWRDNFKGGANTYADDGVSTPAQELALYWYREVTNSEAMEGYDYITLTGHSKGGNKAKYITLMDESPDRCISFDGQGFSDEFYERYTNEIINRQSKIVNHNEKYDFVNILLNDVGDRYYYEVSETNAPENYAYHHKIQSMASIDGKGNVIMVQTEQADGVQTVDDLLNGFLRTVPEKEKQLALDAVGSLVEIHLGGYYHMKKISEAEKYDATIEIISDPDYSEVLGKFAAYVIRYGEYYSRDGSIKELLEEFGVHDNDTVNKLSFIANSETAVSALVDIISGPSYDLAEIRAFITRFIKRDATSAETERLLAVLRPLFDSASRHYKSIRVTGGTDQNYAALTPFSVDTNGILGICRSLTDVYDDMAGCISDLNDIMNHLEGSFFTTTGAWVKLNAASIMLSANRQKVWNLNNNLAEIRNIYMRADSKVGNL